MVNQLEQKAYDLAGSYYDEGFNCAETVFLTYRDLLAPEIESYLVSLFTAFGHGVGQSGCMCGALSGSIAAINMLAGRTLADQSKDEAYALAKEFTKRFTDEYFVTCCRALNPHPYDSPQQLEHCRETTANTARMLMEFLIEKDLYKEKKPD